MQYCRKAHVRWYDISCCVHARRDIIVTHSAWDRHIRGPCRGQCLELLLRSWCNIFHHNMFTNVGPSHSTICRDYRLFSAFTTQDSNLVYLRTTAKSAVATVHRGSVTTQACTVLLHCNVKWRRTAVKGQTKKLSLIHIWRCRRRG